ncbi:MAG TPA: V-type ATP synthase subunit D [Spirochaetota bacterium]|nr:V-type ATP synthase subunit D [Spirochaetota bacterium]HPN82489.1 V-type ATP synthase subunit D [Spirochaetota bacterium]
MAGYAPTKSVLLQVRRTLSFAREGHDLLEQKREFLVMELMHYVNRVRILEKEFLLKNATLRGAYARALFHGGIRPLIESGKSVRQSWRILIKETPVMGLNLPEAKIEKAGPPAFPAGMDGGAAFDELEHAVRDLLSTLVEMAAVKTAVWQLAREVKKTQRRVNALDRIVIPENEAMEKHIQDVLDESERSAFFVQKRIREGR